MMAVAWVRIRFRYTCWEGKVLRVFAKEKVRVFTCVFLYYKCFLLLIGDALNFRSSVFITC